jgi:hypothetical protein
MNDLFLSLIPILCSCNGDLEILLYSRHLLSLLLSFFLKVEGFFTRQLHMCIILGYFYAPRLGVRRDKRSPWRNISPHLFLCSSLLWLIYLQTYLLLE